MRILIIASRSGVGSAISRALTAHPALVTQIVSILDEELEQVTAQRFDAIIIDASFDRTRSRITCLRRAQWPFPILAIGSFADKSHVVALIESGADDCLGRPWQSQELLSRLIALVRRSRGYATSLIAIGDLTLNMNEAQVLRSGVPLVLPPAEYGLLEYLALRRGQRITAHEIAVEAFGPGPTLDTARIEKIIASVSRKISNDSDPIIQTCGTDGYRICC